MATYIGLVVGCSNLPPTYTVSGRVAFGDGAPVDSGTIEFRSVEHGLNARGKISPDGAYELTTFRPGDGAVAGEHQVIVVQHLVVETARPVQHGGTGHAHKPHRVVDRHYASYQDTPLACSVSSQADNVINLEVESPPKETP